MPGKTIQFSEEARKNIPKGVNRLADVLRCALQDAASLGSRLLTTEALIAEVPEEETALPSVPSGGHGGGYGIDRGRAKVIHAEGDYQAATRLQEAASIMDPHPIALQLWYLQTLAMISSESAATTIFPIPLDLITPFLKAAAERGE